jgi:RNA polymerase sigma factor (sigma-70 family)
MNHVDENDDLYRRIRSGENATVAKMIERNLPLVKSRVGVFLKEYGRFRHLFDDLVGEGFMALTDAVNSFATKAVSKPTGYIVSAIDFALSNYVDAEIGAGMMGERTVQRRRANGDSLPEQLPFDIAEPPAHLWQDASGRTVRKKIEDENSAAELPELERDEPETKRIGIGHDDAKQLIARYEQDGKPDLLDQILACCESEEEKTIVRLRIEGYTDEEIGEQLGLSRQTVGRRRKAIEERVNSA